MSQNTFLSNPTKTNIASEHPLYREWLKQDYAERKRKESERLKRVEAKKRKWGDR